MDPEIRASTLEALDQFCRNASEFDPALETADLAPDGLNAKFAPAVELVALKPQY
jgi:hypothetical protein